VLVSAKSDRRRGSVVTPAPSYPPDTGLGILPSPSGISRSETCHDEADAENYNNLMQVYNKTVFPR